MWSVIAKGSAVIVAAATVMFLGMKEPAAATSQVVAPATQAAVSGELVQPVQYYRRYRRYYRCYYRHGRRYCYR